MKATVKATKPAPEAPREIGEPAPGSLLEELLEGLDFNEASILEAERGQAKLFERAARYRVGKMRVRARAEMVHSVAQAEASLFLRREFAGKGEKLTETYLEQLLITRDDIKAAHEALMVAKEEEEYAKLLLEAYQMKRDGMRAVAQVLVGELSFSNRQLADAAMATSLEKVKEKLRAKYPGARRV